MVQGGEILKADVKVVTHVKAFPVKNAAKSWIPMKSTMNDRFKSYVIGNRVTGR